MSDLRELDKAYRRGASRAFDDLEGPAPTAQQEHEAGLAEVRDAVIEALAAEAEYLEPDARLSPRDVPDWLRGHIGDTEATDE